MSREEIIKAVAYLRTSSAANTGADKDSEKGQPLLSRRLPERLVMRLWAATMTRR
jgi:hypothetical protein